MFLDISSFLSLKLPWEQSELVFCIFDFFDIYLFVNDNTVQMVNSIFNTHKHLAENGGNNLILEIEQNFPQEINIKSTLLKRI